MRILLALAMSFFSGCANFNDSKDFPSWVTSSKSLGDGEPLVWQAMEDDRPWCVQSVIFAIRRDDSWRLEHIYRNNWTGLEDNDEWELADVSHGPYESIKVLPVQSNSEAILDFLKKTHWPLAPSQEWKIIEKGVNKKYWLEITGQKVPSELE